jgi:type I restriction enzyme S subunit
MYVTAKNIRPNGIDLRDITYVTEEVHREIFARCPAEYGDVLYIKDGATTGLAALNTIREPISLLSSVALLKPNPTLLEGSYLKHWLNSAEMFRELTDSMTGTAIKRLVLRQIRAARIRVTPLAEQRRIVAKVEALLARVNAARERLEKVPLLLKRFRQAVLAKAFRGELVPTAAELAAREGRSFQSAAELLGQPADAVSGELPEGWALAKLGDIAEIRGGIQKQPKRVPKSNAFPYLRVANVLRGRLDLGEIHRMELFGGELEQYRLVGGDLLVVEGNGSLSEIGRSALWGGEIVNCVHQNHIIRVRSRTVLPKFLDYFWNSPSGQEQVSALAVTTAGLYSLSTKKVANVIVPIAPLAEQRRIVSKIEALLAVAGKVEADAERLARQLERAPQAILQKAFSGELVPTDAELARAAGRNFESAQELLERCRPREDLRPVAGPGRPRRQRTGGMARRA